MRAVAFSRDGKWFAVGGPDSGVAWWAVTDGKPGLRPAGTLPGNRYGVTALTFAPDNVSLLFGTNEGRCYLWRLDRPLIADDYAPRGKNQAQAEAAPVGPVHEGTSVRSIQVASENAPDGRPWVVSVGTDGSGYLWKWRTRDEIPLDQAPGGRPVPLTAVGFTPYPRMLYTGSTAGQVSAWDLRKVRPTSEKTKAEVDTAVTALAIHPAARYLAVAAYRSGITLWPMDPYSKVLSESVIGGPVVLQTREYVDTLTFDPTGQWLAAESRDKRITVYRQSGGTGKGKYDRSDLGITSPAKFWPATAYAFDAPRAQDGPSALPSWLLLGTADGTVRLWDLVGDAGPLLLPGRRSPATAVAISSDRRGAVVGCQDGSIDYMTRLRPGTRGPSPRSCTCPTPRAAPRRSPGTGGNWPCSTRTACTCGTSPARNRSPGWLPPPTDCRRDCPDSCSTGKR